MDLSTYASGYRRLYGTDEEEVRALLGENRRPGIGTFDPANPRLHWWPSSVDFAEEAPRHAKTAVGVANFEALLQVIRRMKNLDHVWWFGHGAAGELQFGNGQVLNAGQLAVLANPNVSSAFNKGADLTFVACNTGQQKDFLQAVTNALRVPVNGYSSGIEWGIEYGGRAPHRHIKWRGIRGTLPTRIAVSPR